MIANEALWGNHQGQYPVEGKATLESAAEDLEVWQTESKPVPSQI